MAVKKKASKLYDDLAPTIDEVINRGGKVTIEEESVSNDAEVRFTLRIPKKMIEGIDKKIKNRPGKLSRNQWIIETINLHLD